MKPVAVINVAKLAGAEIDQLAKLHAEGYVVVFVNDGPAITLHQAAPDRRERIATAVLAGLISSRSQSTVGDMCRMAAGIAGLLIKELDK